MSGLWAMWWRMSRMARNNLRRLAVLEPVRGASVALVLGVVWMLLAALFYAMLLFLKQPEYAPFKARLLESLLAVFFFALFFLVALSDTVLVWGALFRTRAALFHAQMPFNDRALYWCALVEGGFWASWAVMVLALPLVGVLAVESVQPLPYAAAAFTALLAFIACAICAGALGAMILARLIPMLRRGVKGIVALAIGGLLAAAVLVLGSMDQRQRPVQFMHEVIGRLAFAENPYLPPWWTQQAVQAAAASRWQDWLWYVALLGSTAIALALVGEALAGRRLRDDLDALSGRPEPRASARPASRPWRPLPFLPRDLALLASKDLRLFLRDPAQVLQFTMFFGLLAFYLLMLPRIGKAFMFDERWRPAVSLLNLTAIAMALATFTGRFVYPLLSLEGKRLWVLVLAPWPRQRIVTAKFAFALLVGLPISSVLVVLSGAMLELPLAVIAYQAAIIACMGIGLSAGALGIGARLADYNEDNPGKLVAGYGGNVNLLASLLFTALLLAGAAVPLLAGGRPWLWAAGLAWTAGLTAAWTRFALQLAWKWFGRT